ncbi:sodium-dependent transporter [soil metagenome]
MPSPSEQRFSSRWVLLLSVLGIAVGTGNIWRFPRIAAANGGEDGAGAFLIAWLVFLLMWSIPLIIAEYALGQRGRMGVVGTFARTAGRKFGWMGGFVGLVATAIMCYYAVVAGWCFYYTATSFGQGLPVSTEAAMQTWDGFQVSGWRFIVHAMAMFGGAAACWWGVRSIEKVNAVLVPTLLIIVVIAVVRAVTLPGAGAGLAYLFTPTWSDLGNANLWLEALTQNAWDTGAGWGLILTYAAYMKREHGVVRNAVLTGVGNNVVSLLAATMIFATVFSVLGGQQAMASGDVLDVMRSSGPAGTGLTFIWMPQLFAQMPMGNALAGLFFLALSFAALSSLISMIELASRTLVDFGMTRRKAVASVAFGGLLLGLPSVVNLDFFANQDFVWGVALMISGAFVAFAAVRYGTDRLRQEIRTPQDWPLPKGWGYVLLFLVPLQAAVLLGWWLWLSATAYAPETWYNPFDPYSVATCVVQWGIALAALIAANRWMVRKSLPAGT